MKHLLNDIRSFTKARDWGRFHSPKNLSMALMIETGELAEIFQWKETGKSERRELSCFELRDAADEIGDIQIYLMMIADRLNIDPLAAAELKFAINKIKYPISKSRGNSAKYNDLEGK